MADEIATTELLKRLFLISARAWSYKSIADRLIFSIKNIQLTIKEIQYSGLELPPHRQAQIGMLSNTLEKCNKVTETVLASRRWNHYRMFLLRRKMERLENQISYFVKKEILAYILADIILLNHNKSICCHVEEGEHLKGDFGYASMEVERSVEMKPSAVKYLEGDLGYAYMEAERSVEMKPSAVKYLEGDLGYAYMEVERSVEMKTMEALKSKFELVGIIVRKKSNEGSASNEIVEYIHRALRTFTNFPMDGEIQPPQIQVFINFRGAQLRSNFIGYLVDALQRSEVNVFTDNYLNIGDDLENLLKKIEDSGIAIVVFSSRYTESECCLNELVKIEERVNQGLLKVIPVFYKVTPTHVKRLKGKFGDNFRDREYEFRADEPKIKRWKEALESISHKRGLTFDEKSASEIDFVGNIVKEVLTMLQAISTMESKLKLRLG